MSRMEHSFDLLITGWLLQSGWTQEQISANKSRRDFPIFPFVLQLASNSPLMLFLEVLCSPGTASGVFWAWGVVGKEVLLR